MTYAIQLPLIDGNNITIYFSEHIPLIVTSTYSSDRTTIGILGGSQSVTVAMSYRCVNELINSEIKRKLID